MTCSRPGTSSCRTTRSNWQFWVSRPRAPDGWPGLSHSFGSRVGTSISRSARGHPISEVNAVRSSRFSFPTFSHRTRKSGAAVFLAGLRLSWLGVQDRAQNSHGQSWWCGQTRGPSTSYSGSLCEPEYCAQDDNVKEDTVRCEQLRLTHAWGFQGGRFNLEKRPASSHFRSECRALVLIPVSHLYAQDAERLGTRLLGSGGIRWVGVLKTQCPS
jgi:hypothetical protein